MQLPENNTDKNKLRDMAIGQTGYMVPWGMWVDLDGTCYVNEQYPITNSPFGTSSLKVTRVESGYVVHIHESNHKWSRCDGNPFNTSGEYVYGEVVGFEVESTRNVDVLENLNLTKSICLN